MPATLNEYLSDAEKDVSAQVELVKCQISNLIEMMEELNPNVEKAYSLIDELT